MALKTLPSLPMTLNMVDHCVVSSIGTSIHNEPIGAYGAIFDTELSERELVLAVRAYDDNKYQNRINFSVETSHF